MVRRTLLGVAAALVLLSLGVVWSSTPGTGGFLSPGSTTLTNRFNVGTGDLELVPQYTPGFYLPGSVGTSTAGYASDARVALVPALGAFGWALARPSRRARRATALAAYALVALALWGIGQGLVQGPIVAVGAAALAFSSIRGQPKVQASSPSPADDAGAVVGPAQPSPAGSSF